MSARRLHRSVSAERCHLVNSFAARCRDDATPAWVAFALLLLSSLAVFAQTNTLRFRTVDIFVNSTNKPLAAYQLEFTASAGAKIVGVEGGEHAAFKEAPFYDPKAMQHERVIIGAFSTNATGQLPKGRTRVATIHLQTTGDQSPVYDIQLKTAATADGRRISAQASAEERQRNEHEKVLGQE